MKKYSSLLEKLNSLTESKENEVQIRNICEKIIFTPGRKGRSISEKRADKIFRAMIKLNKLDLLCAEGLSEIYSAGTGDITLFVKEFILEISPALKRYGKTVKADMDSCDRIGNYIMFSPRLLETVLFSCIYTVLQKNDKTVISVSNNDSGSYIIIKSSKPCFSLRSLSCTAHIAKLHGGRVITSLGGDCSSLCIFLPSKSSLKPLKISECKPLFCRLCRFMY